MNPVRTELDPESRAQVVAALDRQRRAGSSALRRGGLRGRQLTRTTEYAVALRQSLAVLHRAGASRASLAAIVDIACANVEDDLAVTEQR